MLLYYIYLLSLSNVSLSSRVDVWVLGVKREIFISLITGELARKCHRTENKGVVHNRRKG